MVSHLRILRNYCAVERSQTDTENTIPDMDNNAIKSAIRVLIMFLAARRLTSLVVEDEITRSLREKIVEKFPPETTKIGYLVTCTKCVSVWAAVVIVALDRAGRSELRWRSLTQSMLDTLALSEITIVADEIARRNSASMFD